MRLSVLALLFSAALFAQVPTPTTNVQSDPGGSCTRNSNMQYNVRTGQYWGCEGNATLNWQNGIWTRIAPANVITTRTTDPTGAACDPKSIALRTPGGALFTCVSGVYAAAGGGSPGGATTQVQFNSAGAFAGTDQFTFNGTGLTTIGKAGDTGGTAGLHVMGDGAFSAGAQLWLEADDDNPWALLITNKNALGSQTGMFVDNEGNFNLNIGVLTGFNYQAATNEWSFSSHISTPSLITNALTVATLPTSPVAGQRAFVTDSNAASFTAGIGMIVASGAPNTPVPVFYDGANWRIG